MFEENRCLPLCDICSPAVLSAFGIPLFVPPAALGLRVGVRHKYGIQVKPYNTINKNIILTDIF